MFNSLFKLTLCLGFFMVCTFVQGQEGNPFDLEHRSSSAQKWDVDAKVDLPSVDKPDDTLVAGLAVEAIDPAFDPNQIEGNPFEIGGSKAAIVNIIKAPPPVAPKPQIVLAEGTKSKIVQFKVGMSILLMIALALISTLLRHVIIKIVDGFRSDNLLRTYFRNIGRTVSFPIFLIELFFVLNAAFTCFLICEYLNILEGRPIVEFLKLLLAISIVVFGKHIVLFVIREVFPIQKEVAEYNFTITLFLSILGLILMPCNLILGFAPHTMATISLYFIGIVTVLVLGYLAFRAFLIGSKFLGANRFHFFVYLCTVEIAPILLIVKVIKNSLGS